MLLIAWPGAPLLAGGELVVGEGAKPAVDADATLQSLVVWERRQDGGTEVVGQRFDGLGMPVGGILRISAGGAGEHREPDVAYLANGNAVVVWESRGRRRPAVLGRLFDGLGMPVGTIFRINRRGEARFPAVDAGDDGTFVVAWSGSDGHGSDFRPHARLFDGFGMPVGRVLRFGSSGDAKPPAVAVAADGTFLVSWGDRRDDVAARLFDGIGMPLGKIFRVNASRAGDQLTPAASANPDGTFSVVWERDPGSGGHRAVFGRRVSSIGMPLGLELQINQTPFDRPAVPVIATAHDGRALATWRCELDDVPDHTEIFARAFDGLGMPVGGEIQVNLSRAHHLAPGVTAAGDGRFIVVWQRQPGGGDSDGDSDGDGDASEVLRREIDPP
ncbi:MAG: hypothetical protein D6696_18845 [Acidobacteria bacterium]|nr:MAG: hypothetical protein D6696_18845 [Acidobacteriota bacterium]